MIRGPFGRHAWTMQLRHLPRSKSGTQYHAPNPGRPVPMNEMPLRQDVEQKFFPDGVERATPCVADYSIPTMDAIIQRIGNESTTKLFQLLESQTVFEKLSWAETESSVDSLGHAQEAVPPSVCHEFQAARLFLSHFGFLSLEENDRPNEDQPTPTPPLLTVLDAKKPGFSADLHLLDKLSPRTNDTLHILYVKAGQSNVQEIIENMSEDTVTSLDSHFWQILLSLGWPVMVDEHAGWTGFLHNSWRINTSLTPPTANRRPLNASDEYKYNGEKRVLYWADVGAEIAFVVPTKWNRSEDYSTDGSCLSIASSSSSDSDKSLHPGNLERSLSAMPQTGVANKTPIGQKPRTLSLELDKSKGVGPAQQNVSSSSADPIPPTRRRLGTTKPALLGQVGAKILLVWLESFEDHLTFPMDDVLVYCRTGEEAQSGSIVRASDCHVIFLHALYSGLLRVKLQGPVGRMSFATPLVDGMVISKRVVGSLVRQTVYNMAKRRRLDNDL